MANKHKAAAVPFVNQKGERSMKRVKVERYVAGKKPAYAKDDDEEFYTTDDEDEEIDEDETSDQERFRDDEHGVKESEHTGRDQNADNKWTRGTLPLMGDDADDDDDDDDDDDPRFRVLKQVESKASSSRMLSNQISTLNSRTIQNIDQKTVVIEEDEDEDEEDVKMRHALARARAIEEPIGPQLMLDEYADKQLVIKQEEFELNRSKREETEDILKDLKLTGIKPKKSREKDDAKAQEEIKEMIEQARQEATHKAQLLKKIEEDNKRELAKEAFDKGDIGADDIDAVKTDDEDEELAYEEWKLREIKRVLRDRSERVLEAKAR